MAFSVPNWLRWLTLGPLALLTAAVVQVLVFFTLLSLLHFSFGTDSWVRWAAKSLTSPFMGAAFVAVVWWLAPGRRKAAAVGALGLVAAWASILMLERSSTNLCGFLPWVSLVCWAALRRICSGRACTEQALLPNSSLHRTPLACVH